ncbi:MAG TPA: glycosyltransferase family 9 protein [Thermoanaerobaculia bacterium]|nr:glycosyltransferase family 9 protein [Thermoanaerobaculia bacterium]
MRDDAEDPSLRPPPSSLLVIRLSAFGDVIHTIPAVVALRPHFEIEWAVRSAYREMVEIVAGVRPIAPAFRELRHHDRVVDFQGLIKSGFLAWISGARHRYGFARDFIREKPASWFVNRPVAIDPAKHVVEWNLQLARALAPEIAMPRVDFSPFAADGPRGFEGRVVLLPSAGRPEKEWPVERFRELAKRIGPKALVAWGPNERQRAAAIEAELAPPTKLRELARVLRDASVVIGGDTGPLHLAAALGTRVVGLYGPTNPARNGPYGQIENCVTTFSSTKSMLDISIDNILRKIEQ